jgi:hypothetical protein
MKADTLVLLIKFAFCLYTFDFEALLASVFAGIPRGFAGFLLGYVWDLCAAPSPNVRVLGSLISNLGLRRLGHAPQIGVVTEHYSIVLCLTADIANTIPNQKAKGLDSQMCPRVMQSFQGGCTVQRQGGPLDMLHCNAGSGCRATSVPEDPTMSVCDLF